jgi:outer membrane protein OmpA-like peptidoglycan-associated protein
MHFIRADRGKKAVLPVLMMFFLTLSAFPQQKNSFSLGLFPEANANTRRGYGLAGGLVADYGITRRIAAGLKADYGSDFYDVSSFEAMAFGRYYFFDASPSFSLFAQAGAGFVMLFEGDRMVPSVLGDGALGIRFPVKKFYTEQYIRFGWPAGFGFGLVVGYRFGLKPPKQAPEPPPEPPPEAAPPPALAEQAPEAAPPPALAEQAPEAAPPPVLAEQVPEAVFPGEPEKAPAEPPPPEAVPGIPVLVPEGLEIIFLPQVAHFYDEGEWWLPFYNRNMEALVAAAGFLKDYPEYAVHITGYANPVLGTEEEQMGRLIPLSLERAVFVRDELARLGVDPGRITVSGAGGTPETNRDAFWKNRRAEFRFGKRQDRPSP